MIYSFVRLFIMLFLSSQRYINFEYFETEIWHINKSSGSQNFLVVTSMVVQKYTHIFSAKFHIFGKRKDLHIAYNLRL